MNSDQADRSRQIDALIATLFGLDATLDVTSAVHQSRRHAIERFLALLARQAGQGGAQTSQRPDDSAFHRLWGKYKGLPGYDKAEWTAAFNGIWNGAPGAAPPAGDTHP